MTSPLPYPRIPHLVSRPGATRDDRVLAAAQAAVFLRKPVHVEEKLDGANVVIWSDRGELRVATRGGAGAIDRAGHLGRVRAWMGSRFDGLRALLGDGEALYGEWLLTAHRIRYLALPDLLVGLDLWSQECGFASLESRNERLERAGIVTPPLLFTGIAESLDRLDRLIGPSRFGAERAEGLILRLDEPRGRPARAKLLAAGFVPLDDAAWDGRRPQNGLAAPVGR